MEIKGVKEFFSKLLSRPDRSDKANVNKKTTNFKRFMVNLLSLEHIKTFFKQFGCNQVKPDTSVPVTERTVRNFRESEQAPGGMTQEGGIATPHQAEPSSVELQVKTDTQVEAGPPRPILGENTVARKAINALPAQVNSGDIPRVPPPPPPPIVEYNDSQTPIGEKMAQTTGKDVPGTNDQSNILRAALTKRRIGITDEIPSEEESQSVAPDKTTVVKARSSLPFSSGVKGISADYLSPAALKHLEETRKNDMEKIFEAIRSRATPKESAQKDEEKGAEHPKETISISSPQNGLTNEKMLAAARTRENGHRQLDDNTDDSEWS